MRRKRRRVRRSGKNVKVNAQYSSPRWNQVIYTGNGGSTKTTALQSNSPFCLAGNVARGEEEREKVPLMPRKSYNGETGHCVPSLIIFKTGIGTGVARLKRVTGRPTKPTQTIHWLGILENNEINK